MKRERTDFLKPPPSPCSGLKGVWPHSCAGVGGGDCSWHGAFLEPLPSGRRGASSDELVCLGGGEFPGFPRDLSTLHLCRGGQREKLVLPCWAGSSSAFRSCDPLKNSFADRDWKSEHQKESCCKTPAGSDLIIARLYKRWRGILNNCFLVFTFY